MLNIYKYKMISIAIVFILFIILILIICFIIQFVKYNNKYGGISKTILPTSVTVCNRMTYTISGEKNGLDFSQLRQLLSDAKKYGVTFIEKPIAEKVHISFGTFGDFIIHGKLSKDWHYDPAFFKQKSAIKNTLGNSGHLINKSQLYDTIKKLIPNGIKYFPKCYTIEKIEHQLSESDLFSKGLFPLILKKDNSEQQKGVIIVHSEKEYYSAKEKLYKLELERANKKNIKPSYNIMISEYITNPLLLEGKKFHLRVSFLLSVISGIIRCHVFPIYRIRTAKLPYIKDDWYNEEIHLSGGHNSKKLYYYPDDLQKEYPDHFDIIEKNLNACNKTICMAMVIANIQNYPESYAGYHIYGADIILTDDYYPYLLEINAKPGFGEYGNNAEWDEYNKYFSNKFFSFILNSTIFPLFGIVRPFTHNAEFIGNGTLTPFANILTGNNKYMLIPYLNATSEEIDKLKQIHFFNNELLDTCMHCNIFLISQSLAPIYETNKTNIIGFLVLNQKNYLQVAIIEEFQNRGIATAMIAQFLEIYRMRHFTNIASSIYINRNNMFMIAIAKKLHFIKNKDNHYEYNIAKLDNMLSKHITQNNIFTKHKLTYKIIYENKNGHINLVNDKCMIESNSQFVSFVYNLIHNTAIIKHSTGNKHSKNFIYQGAELKSTLDIKILFGLFLVKLWVYKHDIKIESDIFDKRIKNKEQLILKNKIIPQRYTIYDVNKRNYMILDSSEIKEEYYDINNYFIEEYNPPYLLDGKLMYILYHIVAYITKNGIIKFYIFSKYIILTPKNAYAEDLNNINEMVPKYIDTLKKYDINSISEVCPSYESLYPIIISFLELLVQYEIKPYPESNSGFLEFPLYIKYIKKGDKYEPVIGKIDNIVNLRQNNILDSNFVNEYYKWIRDCVILPHFGIAPYKNIIQPNYGTLSKYIHYTTKKIQYSIIEKIHLEFNSEKTEVVVYNSNTINTIKLYIKYNEIYVNEIHTSIDNSIEINIIFMLMELLRAYYAPIQMFLLLKYEKKNDDIAFELEFAKKDDYYIKKC